MKSKCPVTRSIFNKLVHKQNLPHIEVEAAVKLLQMDAILCKDEEAEEEVCEKKSQGSIDLSCLEGRCLESLAYSWRKLIKKCDGVEREQGSDDETDVDMPVPSMSLSSLLQNLRQFSPSVLAGLLMLTSVQYEDELSQSHRQSRRTREILARKDSPSQNSEDVVHPKLFASGEVVRATYGHVETRDDGDDNCEKLRIGVDGRASE
jgi:hypothetical protein